MTTTPTVNPIDARRLCAAGVTVVLALAACVATAPAILPEAQPAPIAAAPPVPADLVHDAPDDLPKPIVFDAPGAVVRTTVAPTIIDTRTFQPQIAFDEPYTGELIDSGVHRPMKEGKPSVEPGPPNDLVAGGLFDEARAEKGPLFPGISQTPWSPPDPSIAVGIDHIVEVVNMAIAFYEKDGTLLFSQFLDSTGSPGFFEDIGGGDFTFDPKCFYDPSIDRFFVLALEVYSSSDESWITIAISDDGDPNGIWYKYRTWSVVQDGGSTYWVDYPGLGFDDDAFYTTGNLFGLGQGGFGGVLFRTFDKTSMLNGDPVTFTDIHDPSGASVQVAQHFGDNQAPYFVSRNNSTSIKVQAIEDPLGSPSLQTTTVTVPFYDGPGNAPNLGGGTIDMLDGRIMNVHWRDGMLYAAHGIDAADGTGEARWYAFETNDWPNSGSVTLDQVGAVNEGAGIYNFFPAIYSNASGEVAMVLARSASNEYASVMATGRLPSDPPNTMATPTQLAIGSAGASGRWGDYFDIAIDPVDDETFWMVGEYYNADGWITWIGSFTLGLDCPADIAGGPGVDVSDLLALLANFGGPGAGADLAAPTNIVDVADLLVLLAAWGDCP